VPETSAVAKARASNSPKSSACSPTPFQLARDGDHDAALGGAVELGEYQARDADGFVKLGGLGERILSLVGIEHQQDLVRRAGFHALDHAFHFFQLVHEVRLAVQAARRVDDHHVGLAGAAGGDRVEHHGARVGARLLLDDGRAGALRPDAELLDGRRAKGVASGEHHLLARIREAARQLADGGGLAGAIDADHQQHEWLVGADVQGLLRRQQDGGDRVGQRGDELVDVVQFLARHLFAQLFEDLRGGLDAHIGGQQARLQLVEHLGVDRAAGDQIREVVREPGSGPVQLGAQAREEGLGLVFGQRHAPHPQGKKGSEFAL
jgi:hypothetical protein